MKILIQVSGFSEYFLVEPFDYDLADIRAVDGPPLKDARRYIQSMQAHWRRYGQIRL